MKGFAIALSGLLALYLALFLGFRLMQVVAGYLASQFDLQTPWLPFLGFLTIFLMVFIGVLMLGRVFDRLFKLATLGWINRLAGAAFGSLQMVLAAGLLLWLLAQVQLPAPNDKYDSKLYGITTSFAEQSMLMAGKMLPMIGDMLGELDQFFDALTVPAKAE
jgi:uncharacterized membrane protein required for colicin V production